jgi:hypothetical protein
VKRRRLLRLAAALLPAAVLSPVVATAMAPEVPAEIEQGRHLLALLGFRVGPMPAQREPVASILQQVLRCSSPSLPGLQRCSDQEIRQQLRQQIAADYAVGRLQRRDGWQLAATEADILTLADLYAAAPR